MGELLLVTHDPLDQDLREDLAHEGVEVGIALPQIEVLPLEEHEGDDDLEETLLVVDIVGLAVECGQVLQTLPGGLFLEEGLAAASPQQVFPEGSMSMDRLLLSLEPEVLVPVPESL